MLSPCMTCLRKKSHDVQKEKKIINQKRNIQGTFAFKKQKYDSMSSVLMHTFLSSICDYSFPSGSSDFIGALSNYYKNISISSQF